jgi:hypothetical protein
VIENSLVTGPDLPMGCDDPAPARWKCCKCARDCTLVDNPQWAALQESSCCRSAFYRMDPPVYLKCASCGDEFEADEGYPGESDECAGCHEDRCAYELRHAHPAPPTTVAEYIRAKGAA